MKHYSIVIIFLLCIKTFCSQKKMIFLPSTKEVQYTFANGLLPEDDQLLPKMIYIEGNSIVLNKPYFMIPINKSVRLTVLLLIRDRKKFFNEDNTLFNVTVCDDILSQKWIQNIPITMLVEEIENLIKEIYPGLIDKKENKKKKRKKTNSKERHCQDGFLNAMAAMTVKRQQQLMLHS